MTTHPFTRSTPTVLKAVAIAVAVLYGLFLSIFALDSHSPPEFMIHLIPTFLVLAFAWLSWKSPVFGGPAFLLLGIVATWHYHSDASTSLFLLISAPLFLSGVLLLISLMIKK